MEVDIGDTVEFRVGHVAEGGKPVDEIDERGFDSTGDAAGISGVGPDQGDAHRDDD